MCLSAVGGSFASLFTNLFQCVVEAVGAGTGPRQFSDFGLVDGLADDFTGNGGGKPFLLPQRRFVLCHRPDVHLCHCARGNGESDIQVRRPATVGTYRVVGPIGISL